MMLLLNWNARIFCFSNGRTVTRRDVASICRTKSIQTFYQKYIVYAAIDEITSKCLHYAFIKDNQISYCKSRTYRDIASGSRR